VVIRKRTPRIIGFIQVEHPEGEEIVDIFATQAHAPAFLSSGDKNIDCLLDL
jgi:hypothetical protein